MNKKMRKLLLIFTVILIFAGVKHVQAKSDDVIHFKDKNLESALCDIYQCETPITKKMAHEFSTEDTYLSFLDSNISDLEGLQFFDGLTQITLWGNNISNLKPLSQLPNLNRLEISNSQIRGKDLEDILNNMGKIEKLDTFICYENEIEDISFLKKIGNPSKYKELYLSHNNIEDISILKGCQDLQYLYLDNNRITDVTPLSSLKNNTIDLFLQNNCIIDFKPMKSLFDLMFETRCGGEFPLDRVDFYQNPVAIRYQNKEIPFPHMTVYYLNQAYVEAIPFIEALGGKAEYNKDTGILTCKYNDNELILKDFSTIYSLNGTDKRMAYEMRRMQYDIAYVSVEDFCNILGINYHVIKERALYNGESETPEKFPEVVEISKYEESGRVGNYKYRIIDNQVGIIRYLGNETNVLIPSQIKGFPVTYIEDGAFYDNLNLLSVEIPNTVTRIGSAWGEKGVFTNCDKLVSVKIIEGTKDASIGIGAFYNCNKLSSIHIPGNYKIIYDEAFYNCTSLRFVTISEGVEKIGAGAFAGDTSLTSVTLPSTLKELGYEYDENATNQEDLNETGVFAYCSALKTVTILAGKEEAYIGDNTFYECIKLENITIPGNYKEILNNAFYNCTNLKSVIFEKSNQTKITNLRIDDNAFERCIGLEEVKLPETLLSIGEYAFVDCTSLKELVVPEGVTRIGNEAFAHNTALQSVSIPSTMIALGNYSDGSYEGGVFEGCTNLLTVTLKEGNKKATIGTGTFQGCSNLKSIIIPGNYVKIGREAFIDCVGLKTVIYKNNSNPATKQRILSSAFEGCTSLVKISLPSTLTYLDDSVFEGCTALKTIKIPTGINQLYISSFIFYDCNSLASVTIGDNVKCNKYAFSLTNSTKVTIYSNNKTVKKLAKFEGFKVLPLESTK